MMIVFGAGAGIFMISVVPFVTTSSDSSASGSQKNENSEMGFGREFTVDEVNFEGDEIFIETTS